MKVDDGQTFAAGFDVGANGILDLSDVTGDGITVGVAAGADPTVAPAAPGNIALSGGANLTGNGTTAAVIIDATAAAGEVGQSVLSISGAGNTVTGLIDASGMNLDSQGNLALNADAELTVGSATQGEGTVNGAGKLTVKGDYILDGGTFSASELVVEGALRAIGGEINTNSFTSNNEVETIESGTISRVGTTHNAAKGIHVKAGGVLASRNPTVGAGAGVNAATLGDGAVVLVDKEGTLDLSRGSMTSASGRGAALDGFVKVGDSLGNLTGLSVTRGANETVAEHGVRLGANSVLVVGKQAQQNLVNRADAVAGTETEPADVLGSYADSTKYMAGGTILTSKGTGALTTGSMGMFSNTTAVGYTDGTNAGTASQNDPSRCRPASGAK